MHACRSTLEDPTVPAADEIDLSSQVSTVLEEFRIAAAASEVSLATKIAVDRPLRADKDLFHRVLANLIENAVRHSPDGGIVTISAAGEASAVVVRVADTGSGVPEDQRARVFDRFESTGGARNRGLGLAFCKIAVEAHGGEIWIEDAAPGAVFCLRFPS